MNPVDEKTVIVQGHYQLKERKDSRIIVYAFGSPIASFERLGDLVKKLQEREDF